MQRPKPCSVAHSPFYLKLISTKLFQSKDLLKHEAEHWDNIPKKQHEAKSTSKIISMDYLESLVFQQ